MKNDDINHHDKNNVPRWSNLSLEERENHNLKARTLIRYLNKHRNQKVLWGSVNNALGLCHLYRWVLDDYNATHHITEIKTDDTGIWMEDKDEA